MYKHPVHALFSPSEHSPCRWYGLPGRNYISMMWAGISKRQQRWQQIMIKVTGEWQVESEEAQCLILLTLFTYSMLHHSRTKYSQCQGGIWKTGNGFVFPRDGCVLYKRGRFPLKNRQVSIGNGKISCLHLFKITFYKSFFLSLSPSTLKSHYYSMFPMVIQHLLIHMPRTDEL